MANQSLGFWPLATIHMNRINVKRMKWLPLRARTFMPPPRVFTSRREGAQASPSAATALTWGVLCLLQHGKSTLHLKLLSMFWVTMPPLCSNWLACSLSVTVCDIQTNKWIQKWESLFIMFSFAPHMGFQCSIFQNVILLRKTKNNKTNKTPRYNKSTHRKHKYF